MKPKLLMCWDIDLIDRIKIDADQSQILLQINYLLMKYLPIPWIWSAFSWYILMQFPFQADLAITAKFW